MATSKNPVVFFFRFFLSFFFFFLDFLWNLVCVDEKGHWECGVGKVSGKVNRQTLGMEVSVRKRNSINNNKICYG